MRVLMSWERTAALHVEIDLENFANMRAVCQWQLRSSDFKKLRLEKQVDVGVDVDADPTSGESGTACADEPDNPPSNVASCPPEVVCDTAHVTPMKPTPREAECVTALAAPRKSTRDRLTTNFFVKKWRCICVVEVYRLCGEALPTTLAQNTRMCV
jgi:hypothetical protein